MSDSPAEAGVGLPRVVIVGRPNVGKSSLFNWLAEKRIAIEDATAGVTRDRLVQRVVLELDDIGTLDDTLVDAIAELDRRLGNGGGTLRICGLSEANLARLRTRSGLADMPHFAGRLEAAGPRTGMPGRPLAR